MTPHAEPAAPPGPSFLDQALDRCVFAPIGLAVFVHRRFPDLVKAGRDELESRVRTARAVGQFAVTIGTRQLRKRMELMANRAAGSTGRAAGPADGEAIVTDPAPSSASVAPPPEVIVAAATAPIDVEHLAIVDYDSLAASQIVSRLDSLTPIELAQVGGYEAAHRHRRTVLLRVEQLLS
jgi:hypothetical protein